MWSNKLLKTLSGIFAFYLVTSCFSCSTAPEAIEYGVNNCEYCKMTIVNPLFGAELITGKGRVYKFDEIGCLKSYLHEKNLNTGDMAGIYVADFCGVHELIRHEQAFFLEGGEIRSPMGGNVAAFKSEDSLRKYMVQLNAMTKDRNEIISLSR